MKIRLSLEYKLIFAMVFFAVFIVQFQHHQLADRVPHEIALAKESRNRLLVDTIKPIITLNLAFGLEEANRSYLEHLCDKNVDIVRLELLSPNGRLLFRFVRTQNTLAPHSDLNFRSERIFDTLGGTLLGKIEVQFSDDDYREMIEHFDVLHIRIALIAIASLIVLILVIRRMLAGLRLLHKNVEAFDPKRNNFNLTLTNRSDEVGVIHNAIVRMQNFAHALDQANATLESKVMERTAALESANAALEKLSATDVLTDLPNRRYFQERFSYLWQLAQRNQVPLALIICDIDHFKRFNDTWGHATGDQVLQSVSGVLKSVLKRKSDMVARYGGEEFVLVLYGVDTAAAVALCENIRQTLRLTTIEHNPVSMSYGVAHVQPESTIEPDSLLQAADKALYEAKQSGRDRIVVSPFRSAYM